MHDERTPGNSALTRPSRRLLSFFARYLHWYIGRHFHGIRLANSSRFPVTTGPLIIFANHASWWDPLAFIVVSRRFLPHASPLWTHGRRCLEALLSSPQARPFPCRKRHPARSGPIPARRATDSLHPQFCSLGHARRPLYRRAHAGLQSSALVWPRWPPGSTPALLCPWPSSTLSGMNACRRSWFPAVSRLPWRQYPEYCAEEWNERLCAALVAAQDELADLAKLRDPARFETILSGRVGMSGVYEAWKRLAALLTGRVYQGSHGSIHRS